MNSNSCRCFFQDSKIVACKIFHLGWNCRSADCDCSSKFELCRRWTQQVWWNFGILLRQIDAAKSQWALEHGLTNEALPSRIITTKDLAPYLGHEFTGNDLGDPKYGESLYSIRDLNQPLRGGFDQRVFRGQRESLTRHNHPSLSRSTGRRL